MGASDKPSDLDFDALLRSTAVETYGREDVHGVLLGDMAQGLAQVSNLDSLPPSVILGNAIAPEYRYGALICQCSISSIQVYDITHFCRDVSLRDVLGAVVAHGSSLDGVEQQPIQSTLNVAQCMDIWAREMQASVQRSQGHGRPVIMSGSVLPLRTDSPTQKNRMAEPQSIATGERHVELDRRRTISRKRTSDGNTSQESSKGKRATKEDQRSVRNRESAAKSRKKRQQYTNELEERVKLLKDTNKELRRKIICAAKAPPDPYAGILDGKKLRRTRTMPL